MNKRNFIKRGALWIAAAPFILTPRKTLAQGATRGMLSVVAKKKVAAAGNPPIPDLFTRGDSADVGTNWTPTLLTKNMKIVSNGVVPGDVTLDSYEIYTGATWTANQSSQVVITGTIATGAGAGLGVCVRMAAPETVTLYRLIINSDADWALGRIIAGSFTAIASGTVTYSSGAILFMSAIGTSITAKYNGAQLGASPFTDSNIATGSPGIGHSSTTTGGSIDEWTGQDGL